MNGLSLRVPESMPLYDILNEFQKGHSHMAVVVRECNDKEHSAADQQNEGKSRLNSTILLFKLTTKGEKKASHLP